MLKLIYQIQILVIHTTCCTGGVGRAVLALNTFWGRMLLDEVMEPLGFCWGMVCCFRYAACQFGRLYLDCCWRITLKSWPLLVWASCTSAQTNSLPGGRYGHRTAIGHVFGWNKLWFLYPCCTGSTSDIVIGQLTICSGHLLPIKPRILIVVTSITRHAHQQLLTTGNRRVSWSSLWLFCFYSTFLLYQLAIELFSWVLWCQFLGRHWWELVGCVIRLVIEAAHFGIHTWLRRDQHAACHARAWRSLRRPTDTIALSSVHTSGVLRRATRSTNSRSCGHSHPWSDRAFSTSMLVRTSLLLGVRKRLLVVSCSTGCILSAAGGITASKHGWQVALKRVIWESIMELLLLSRRLRQPGLIGLVALLLGTLWFLHQWTTTKGRELRLVLMIVRMVETLQLILVLHVLVQHQVITSSRASFCPSQAAWAADFLAHWSTFWILCRSCWATYLLLVLWRHNDMLLSFMNIKWQSWKWI